MGLFTRRGNRLTGATDSQWRPDKHGAALGPDIGGDIQRGDAYEVRFIREDLPGSLITVTFYAVEFDECPGEFVVQRQVEWMVCEDPADPGGTEIWSRAAYDVIPDVFMRSEARAEEEARKLADAARHQASQYAGWDGLPDWNRGAS
jgi:hypothetical protein